MTLRRRDVVGWLGGGMAAAATGAGWRAARAAAPAPKAVRIAGGASFRDGKPRFSGYSYIIAEHGELERELGKRGIGLEWFTTAHAATGPMINEGFANGRIDFASYGDLPSAILNAGGVQTRIVMANGAGGGDAFLVVPAGSTAKSIADLKGQRLAIHRGRPWELPLLRLLDANHLSYGDFKLININPQAGMAALAAGHVEALFTMTDAYLLEDKKVGRIIWSTKQAPLDWKTRTDFFGAKSFIDQYPEVTQVVVNAYVKAAHWASHEENRAEMIKIAMSNGTPESVVRRSYERDGVTWRDRWSPLFSDVVREHYRKTLDLAWAQKLIRKPLELDSLFDSRFLGPALGALKLGDYWKPVKQG
jgi:sulfonate transport system substrate-binding protein